MPGLAGASSFFTCNRRNFSVVCEHQAAMAHHCCMRTVGRITVIASIFLGLSYTVVALAGVRAGQTTSSKPSVYVSDFLIDVLPSQPPAQKPEDDPRKVASHLVELMSSTLVAALQKGGYSATRLRSGDSRPESGVKIRGLFAEIDGENHWRRAVIHTATDSGKMQALVAVANLAKPEQALYEIANLPGNEDKPGAVITLSPYVPLTKFDLTKDADENAFKAIAPRVVKDLNDLLTRNPYALPQ
jgi:hypothetical protein